MSQVSVVNILRQLLANSYALYVKTQNYHWNVDGANFLILHAFFETQYRDLAEAIDTFAELIRGLGDKVEASLSSYARDAKIEPGRETATDQQMLKDLLSDHRFMEKQLQEAMLVINTLPDDVVADFCIERMQVHRKTAWMIASCLA